MKILKIHYSQLKCPHCGATDFNLQTADVFFCNYCKEKFNFELESLDFSNESVVFREELKEQFREKVLELHKKIIDNRLLLNKCLKSASSRMFMTLSICFLVISLTFVFSLPLVGLPLLIISLITCFFARKRAEIRRNKYQPMVNFYASKIVDCEKEIYFYNALISKLTT